jgi:hypothetical protein
VVSSFPIIRDTVTKTVPIRETWFTTFLTANPIVGVTSSIIAAVWQHTIAATSVPLMQAFSKAGVVAEVGPAATALVWWVALSSMVTGVISFRAGIYVGTWGDWDEVEESSDDDDDAEESERLRGPRRIASARGQSRERGNSRTADVERVGSVGAVSERGSGIEMASLRWG